MATSYPATAAASASAFRANKSICQRAASLYKKATETQANQAYRAAHAFAVERGLKVDTQEYFKYCDDALELYAKDYGLRYDPSEKVPHANEVCAMSGLTYDQYNAQHRKMYAEGRDSNSQAKAQWWKPVG